VAGVGVPAAPSALSQCAGAEQTRPQPPRSARHTTGVIGVGVSAAPSAPSLPILLVLCSTIVAGCNSARDDYEQLWGRIAQPNPPVKFVQPDDPRNLFQAKEFTSGSALLVRNALNPDMKALMQQHGLQPNLSGYIELMTAPLAPPDKTPTAEIARARFMLSMRAFLWGGFDLNSDRSAEIHLSATGAQILVPRDESRGGGTFYADQNGVMSEYGFTPDGQSGTAPLK
jgi:hypothetical protein